MSNDDTKPFGFDEEDDLGETLAGPSQKSDADEGEEEGEVPAPGPASEMPVGVGLPSGLGTGGALSSSASMALPTEEDEIFDTKTGGDSEGRILANRFEVVRLLGKGGMGRVYLVRDRQIEKRLIALKLLRSKHSKSRAYAELFFREVRTAQGFVSENVVQIRDCGRLENGHLFMTMDYVDGESLHSLRKREKTLAPKHAMEIVVQILHGLASGHEKGFIHRDVKPQNIMLAANKSKTEKNPFGVHVGLLDFGIAGLIEEVESERGAGSAPYFSPEQASGDRLDVRSDLFSVGIILFELIDGHRPFAGRTALEVGESMREVDLVPLIEGMDGVPTPLKRVLRKALNKDREDRYQSAAEFAKAIDEAAAAGSGTGPLKWAVVAASVFGLLAIAEGVYIQDLMQREYADQSSAQNVEDISANTEGRIDELTRTLALETKDKNDAKEEIKGLSQLIQTNEQDLTDLREELSAVRDEKDASGHKEQVAEIELINKVAESEAQLTTLTNRLSSLSQVNDRLRSDNAEFYALRSRKLQTANAFTGILSDISKGVISAGYDPLKGLLDRDQLVTDQHSRIYLEDLVHVARALPNTSLADEVTLDASEIEVLGVLIESLAGQRKDRFLGSALHSDSDRWLGTVARSEGEVLELLRNEMWESFQESGAAMQASIASGFAPGTSSELATAEPASVNAGYLGGDVSLTESGESEVRKLIYDFIPERSTLGADLFGFAWNQDAAEAQERSLSLVLVNLERRRKSVKTLLTGQALDQANVLKGKVATNPGLVADYYRTYGELALSQLEGLVQAVVITAEASAIAGGKLQSSGLENISNDLSLLAGQLISDDTSSGVTEDFQGVVNEGLVHRLAWLSIAENWYRKRNRDDQFLELDWVTQVLEQALDVAAGLESWQTVLSLQVQIGAQDQENFFPPQEGAILVFHQTRIGTNTVLSWEEVEALAYMDDRSTSRVAEVSSHLVTRLVAIDGSFDSDMASPRNFNLVRTTGSLVRSVNGQPKLVLVSPQKLVDDLVAEFWKPSAEALEHFETLREGATRFNALEGHSLGELLPPESDQGYLCLKSRVSDTLTVWIHPILGIVREEYRRGADEPVFRILELIYACQ